MKIFLFTKRTLLIIFFSFILILFTAIYIFSASAVEEAFNSEVSDSFLDKVNNLTHNSEKIAYLTFVPDYCSHVFRFPNGFMSPNNKSRKKIYASLLFQMNYTYIDWNCLNNDSLKKYTNTQLLNNLKNSSKNKNTLVVLMHDTKYVNDSSLVLKDSITFLRSQNYEFRNFYSLIE